MTMTINETRVYMTPKAAPLLKDQKLCTFLEDMNREEIDMMDKEEQPLNTKLDEIYNAYSWTAIMKDGLYAALGLGSLISAVKYTYNHALQEKPFNGVSLGDLYDVGWKRDLPAEEEKVCQEKASIISDQRYIKEEKERMGKADYQTGRLAIIGAIVACASVIAVKLARYSNTKYNLSQEYNLSINEARYLRLQHRIRQIGEKLQRPENEQEKIQLQIVQDYFQQKFNKMHVAANNTITVNHRKTG